MAETRVGIGYDVHRLVPGRRLVLAGVEIESELGLDGHSDADVALHALCDALLGAAALGDIGHHFPSGDARWKDADSLDLLQRVRELLADYAIGNVDITIVAERPRLAPHVDLMRTRIGDALGLAVSSVSVKATTNERIGFVGRGEGIAALAVATIVRTP